MTSNELIEAVKKENPDAIGLSGLLVKSAQQMVLTAQDLKQQKISLPILVGGAALTRKFTNTRIAPEYDGLVLYAKDAMNGLEIANRLAKKEERGKLAEEVKAAQEKRELVNETKKQEVKSTFVIPERSDISEAPVFKPNDLTPHILRDYELSHLEPYINMQMLLGRHLGLQGKVSRLLTEGDKRAIALKEKVDQFLLEAKKNKMIKAHGMYQFFPAQAEGNDVIIYDPTDQKKILQRFRFPRQNHKPFLCLADYLRPVSSGEMDYVAFWPLQQDKVLEIWQSKRNVMEIICIVI